MPNPGPAPAPISALEIDALAAKLAPEIAKRHFGRVIVFGASGPGDEPTQLGRAIGDAMSKALARDVQGFKVIDRGVMRDVLKKMRMSETSLLNDYLVAWICPKVQAGGAVVLQIKSVGGNAAVVEANLFDSTEMEKKPAFTGKATLALDDSQAKAAMQPLNSEGSFLHGGARGGDENKDGVSYATCEYCPRPDYSNEARALSFSGDVWLATTVLPDGTATDISILKGLGHGLDAKAVEALLTWKFKPGLDKEGHPAEKRTIVQMQFQIFKKEKSSGNGQLAGALSNIPNIPTTQEMTLPPGSISSPAASRDPGSYPTCIHCPRPDYSKEARENKIEGDVWLEAFVTVEGKVGDIRVTKSLGYGLDEEAIKAVKGWKFRPAVGPDGKPISTWISIQVQFQRLN